MTERTIKRFTKNRLGPYKLLVLLQYGDYDFVEWKDATTCRVATGKFARLLMISNGKVREWYKWLLANGLISYLNLDHGFCTISLIPFPVRRASVEREACVSTTQTIESVVNTTTTVDMSAKDVAVALDIW